MNMRAGMVLVCALVASACVKSETQQCGEYTCSLTSVCAPSGDRCVSQQQLDACTGKTDGMGCSFPGTDVGVCDTDVCVAGGCGNGVIETESDEVCDDGNRISGDGCRADCQSLETCGDGITDFSVGESCDCGTNTMALPFGCNGINSMDSNATCRPNCSFGRCGDMVKDLNESCDDGNAIPGDGCRADCQGRWTRFDSNTLATLVSVWASSKTDLWVLTPTAVRHWNGIVWTDRTPPSTRGFDPATASFTKIWGISSQEVFALRDSNAGSTSQVWRYFNGTWQEKTPDLAFRWSALHANGSNLWIFGRLSNGAIATAHWNAGTMLFDPLETVGTSATAPTDAFVVSANPNDKVYMAADAFWSRTSGAPTLWASGSPNARVIGAVSATDMTLFSGPPTAGYHFNGNSLTPLMESTYFNVRGIYGVTGLTLAVGDGGHVLDCNATTCTPVLTGVVDDLYDVFLFDTKQGFLVGEFGTILY